jgi:hypothetical protein
MPTPVSLTHYGVLHEGPSEFFRGVYRDQWYPLCQYRAPSWFTVGVIGTEVVVHLTDEPEYTDCALCAVLLASGVPTYTTEDQPQQHTMK